MRVQARALKRRSTFALCLVYVLFSLAPHFELLTHSHAYGDRPHTHHFLSAHDIQLEREVLSAAIPGGADAGSRPEETPPAASVKQDSEGCSHGTVLPPGAQGLKKGGWAAHTHGQEDPNVAALRSPARDLHLACAPLPRQEPPVACATDRPAPRAGARAPPARA